jgi:hypothetical protein
VLFNTLVSELSPLADAPIEYLDLRESTIVDLSPLNTLPIKEFTYENQGDGFSDL